jgi:hypothetical protein
LKKQALILSNAEKQQEHHPNDKDRSLFIEIAFQKLEDDIIQAKQLYLENDVECFDILKNKIPEKKLEELKIIATKLYKINVSMYETSNSHFEEIAEIEEIYTSTFRQKQNVIGEAFTYYILYNNENPNDESNIECDEHFNIWLHNDIPEKSKKHKNKHRRR